MKAVFTCLLLALVLWGCNGERPREVYACEGPWQRLILEEGGRALVTTAAGVREASYVTRDGMVSITIPTLPPVDLAVQGDRLQGEDGIRCEKVLED